MKTDWTTLKFFLDQKSLSVQYLDTPSEYYVYANDGAVLVESILNKTPSDTSDLDDFESNYKSAGNKPNKQFVVSDVGYNTMILQPRGIYFDAAANSNTTNDYELDVSLSLRGAIIYLEGGQIGDWVESFIIDIDNILGYGANFILSTYVKKFYAIPGQSLELINPIASNLIPSGLYLRNVYHNTGNANAKCIINLYSYIE